jgi:hypothetical protein
MGSPCLCLVVSGNAGDLGPYLSPGVPTGADEEIGLGRIGRNSVEKLASPSGSQLAALHMRLGSFPWEGRH